MLLKMSFDGYLKRIGIYYVLLVLTYFACRFLSEEHTTAIIWTCVLSLGAFVHLMVKDQIYNQNSFWIKNLPIKRSEIVLFVLIKNIVSLFVIFFTWFLNTYVLMFIELVMSPEKHLSSKTPINFYAYSKYILENIYEGAIGLVSYYSSFNSPAYNTASIYVFVCLGAGVCFALFYPGKNYLKDIFKSQKNIGLKRPSFKKKASTYAYICLALVAGNYLYNSFGILAFSAVLVPFIFILVEIAFSTSFGLKQFNPKHPRVAMTMVITFSGLAIHTYGAIRINHKSLSLVNKFSEASQNNFLTKYITDEDVKIHFERTKFKNQDDIVEIVNLLRIRDGIPIIDSDNYEVKRYNIFLKGVNFQKVISNNKKYTQFLFGLFDPAKLSIEDIKVGIEYIGSFSVSPFSKTVVYSARIKSFSKYLSYREFTKGELLEIMNMSDENAIHLSFLLNKEFDKMDKVDLKLEDSYSYRRVSSKVKFDFSNELEVHKDNMPLNRVNKFRKIFREHKTKRSISSITDSRHTLIYPRYYDGYIYRSLKPYSYTKKRKR